jgi:hypothetical protein
VDIENYTKTIIKKSDNHNYYFDDSNKNPDLEMTNKYIKESIEIFENKRTKKKEKISQKVRNFIAKITPNQIDKLKIKDQANISKKFDSACDQKRHDETFFNQFDNMAYMLWNDEIENTLNQLMAEYSDIFNISEPIDMENLNILDSKRYIG